jgi:beta-glucanase (GH16 family)
MIPIVCRKSSVKFHPWLWCSVALVLSLATPARAAWTLVWADEFEQANGTSPDSSKWGFDVGGGGFGNNQQEYNTARTNNARIQDGHLVIEAKQENYMGRSYTSARMLTKGKAAWTYGRIEARIKIPRGQGIWPAFWTLGTNIDGAGGVGWPACGEIDIMENIGKTNNNEQGKIYGTIHGPAQGGGPYNGGAGVGSSYTLPGGAKYADDFHIFAIEWTTNQIKWYMDDQQYFTATPNSLPAGGTWPFTKPQFILLNVAVGGNWPGYPSNYTVFPQQMLVDYVRVYSFSNAPAIPPTTSGVLSNGGFESGLLAPWVGKDFGNANPSGGVIVDTNGLVWNPVTGAVNTQNIKNPANGMYACKVYGNYTGGPNSPGFYQDVDALPGSLWTASIKARSQNTDHIRDLNQSVVEVSFFDLTSTLVAKYASQVFTTNTPINTWVTMAVTNRTFPTPGTTNLMRAPPGTARLRFEVTFSQAVYDWGSIYYDDAQLQEVAVTRPLLNAFWDGANIQISFATQQGVSYQVQYKNQISDATWTPLQTIAGDGTTKTVLYPATAPWRFYSVQVL